jgi:hypothetical protein
MKNILLATTALVMTAGFASAEVKFSGKAEGGVSRTAKTVASIPTVGTGWAYNATTGLLTLTATGTLVSAPGTTAAADATAVASAQWLYDALVAGADPAANGLTALGLTTAQALLNLDAAKATQAKNVANRAYLAGTAAVAAGDIAVYSGYDFDVSLSGASDNGITFAAGFDMGAGSLADTTDDLALEAQGATIGAATVSASMNGYTVAFKSDGISDVYDDTQNGDVSVAGTIGTVTFKVVHDLEADTAAVAAVAAKSLANVFTAATAATAAVYNTTSYTLGTTVGGIGLSLTGTDKNDVGLSGMKAKATYSMDALTFGLETNNRGDSTKMLNATKISVAYAGEGVSVSASSNDDKDWDLSATLSSGANSATFVTDEESAWNAQVASDLGGGASVFGYVDNTELFMAGVRFKF